MDRIWQWAWDRFAARYSWAFCAVTFPPLLPIYLVSSFVVVAFQGSDRYVEAAVVTAVAVLMLLYATSLPGVGPIRVVEKWAAGGEVDPARALEATYSWARGAISRSGRSRNPWLVTLSGPPCYPSLSV